MNDFNKKTLDEIHDYWINQSIPKNYIKHVKRSEFLAKYVKNYIEPKGKIIEIGCNVGRNLNHLYENDFKKLTGIEISEKAIIELKKTYPSLYESAEIIHSPIEDIIKDFTSNHFDLVFTMAVLQHIHPDSEWIFEEIANITKSYLIIIEAEKQKHWRVFPRNYKEIFEKLGLKQVEENIVDQSEGLKKYTVRVFKKLNS
ncbi:class I SAM-dependent methyltransferase [Gracilibacillus sp. D59]|uniref:class I SAM-dependent methyltransferase n=1 Tax=Gracilibacillus sp. D59 TaxID=3457434 RepID=UPI003FCDB473